jgi:hypothetical protein
VLSGPATNGAGLSTTATDTVKVDLPAPSVPVVTLDPASRLVTVTTNLTATTSETLSGLAGGEWWIGADPGIGSATPLTVSGSSLIGVIPATLVAGTYSVSVRAADIAGNWSGAGTAALTVTAPPNVAPTATSQTVTTDEDTAVAIVLAGADPNVGDTLSFTVVSQPAHGVLSGTAPNLTYTPAANFNGSASFDYTISDGHGGTSSATATVTVNPVNDAPVANPVTLSATSGQPTLDSVGLTSKATR